MTRPAVMHARLAAVAVLPLLVVSSVLAVAPLAHGATSALAPAPASGATSAAAVQPFLGIWEADLATAKDPQLSLTPAAVAQQRQWVPGRDDPLLRCIAPGMPSMISNPYPISLAAEPDGLAIRYEEFGSSRRLLWRAPTRAPTPTAQGLSIAHLDDGVLEVHTTRIAPGFFNRDGLAQSAATDVLERYSVSSDGKVLTLDMRVTDPPTFTAPVQFLRRWRRASPGTELLPYECVPDTSFEDVGGVSSRSAAPPAGPATPPVPAPRRAPRT